MKKFLLLASLACGLTHAAPSASAQSFTGLGTGGVTLSVYSGPGATPTAFAVTGLATGDTFVGIDRLASTGQLFGLTGGGTLYSLTQATATTYAATTSTPSTLTGSTVIDFNPMANRLRVYTSAGTTNRLTPGTGLVTADGMLSFAAGDANSGTPALTAAAYTNNFGGPASTRLFSLDATRNILVENVNGTGVAGSFAQLNTVATLTLSGLTFDITAGTTGFDIVTVAGVDSAYLTSNNTLYSLNLANGVMTSLGSVGTGIIDVAFVPEPGTYAMLALGALGLAVVAVRHRRHAVV